ncbi:MAG: hypothetical protein KDJ98_15145 [Rhodobacteraceae bacterium]|nr:hypothetical protein [Paracoccaceae bacterium]
MSGLIKIAAVAAAGFHRCGQFWPQAGRIVDPDALGPEVVARLAAEPQLHIAPAPEGEAEAVQAASLRDQVKAAIGTLEAEGFDEAGAPKLDALKKALPKGTRGVTAALLAEVWAELNPAG